MKKKFFMSMTRIVIMFLMILLFTVPAFADMESNDTKNEAEIFKVNTTITGHIGYKHDDGTTDSHDYYKMVLPSDGKLDVKVNTEVNLKSLSLNYSTVNDKVSLVDLHTGTDTDGSNGYHVYRNLAAGTYYIKLDYDGKSAGDYTLTNHLTPISQSNDEENNDIVENAQQMMVNTSTEGHIGYKHDDGTTDSHDYYKVVLPSDGKLDVKVNTEVNLKSLSLNYINVNGVLALVDFYTGKDTDGSNGYHVYKDLEAGSYYIKLDYDGKSAGGYTLTNTFTSSISGDIPVSNITLDKSSVDMEIGETTILTATINPSDATNKSIVWESKDTTVATVDQNGVVTAVASGSVVITAQFANSEISASCMVNIAVDSVDNSYEEWADGPNKAVEKNKKWTIKFSKKIDQRFINREHLYVKNSSGNKITDTVQAVTGNLSEVKILPPNVDYTPGMAYTLYIEGDILAEDGSSLSNGIKMEFIIKDNSLSSGQNTLAHRGFDFSAGDFRSDEDAYDAEFSNRKDGAIIFWEPVEAGDEGRGQYVWIESPDEELKENIVADMGMVSFASVANASGAVFEHLSPALLSGHVYIIKTKEGGYAKIEVLATDSDAMTADVKWQYSTNGSF